MSRFLTTIPSNSGFVNLGLVETYPTGGGGPTAYGPTSYFGSDPLPAEQGDNLNNPIDLGDFSSIFKSLTLKNTHGGLTRKQTTFYKIRLKIPRSIQFTQDFSQFSYEENTNRNTLLAFYEILEDGRREELPINDQGYVHKESSIDYADDDNGALITDYPRTTLGVGNYLFLITNDIRYLETNYSISLNVSVVDWRFVSENILESINFGLVTNVAESTLDFGSIT
jgi:hypothetical protein|tara:strand:- start:3587 stop:4261 length:675 start_codon:yes stop_codon:yes gene_type:complete